MRSRIRRRSFPTSPIQPSGIPQANADEPGLQILSGPPYSNRLLRLHDFDFQSTAIIHRTIIGDGQSPAE